MLSSSQAPADCSLMLTKTGVAKICRGGNFTVFRKCFSDALCNFDTTTTPTAFLEIENNLPLIKCIGTHGYSSVSTCLRRSWDSEPFTTHPVAMALQAGVNPDRHLDTYRNNFNLIDGAVSNFESTGTTYRMEITMVCKLTTEAVSNRNMNIQFQTATQRFRSKCIELIEKYGVLYPNSTFPAALRTMTFGFKQPLDVIMNRIRNRETIPITIKETACAIENLLLFCLNGNPRNLTHSYFSATRIRENIDTYSFPYTCIDIDPDTLQTFLTDDYYCGLKLLQQCMNPLTRNHESERITNELHYRLERMEDDRQCLDFQESMIMKLLERLFRRDLALIFKKRMLKTNIAQDIKFCLMEKEPEYAFFDELERQVSIKKVTLY
jgi:hypothetical protein